MSDGNSEDENVPQEPEYSLQDITNISRKVAMVLKLSRMPFAFEDKDFSPPDILPMLERYYATYHHQFRITLTIDEAREICNILMMTGEFCGSVNDPDVFQRSRYCSPLHEWNIASIAPHILESKIRRDKRNKKS